MSTQVSPGLFSDFLRAAGVPHTVSHSEKAFASMPFNSLFGLSKLLDSYGVDTLGVRLADKSEIEGLRRPFIAHTPGGFVIVTDVSDRTVSYLTQGVAERMPAERFAEVWDGVALLASPRADASEPDYSSHRFLEVATVVKRYLLWACAAVLFLSLFIGNGLWRHPSLILVALLDIAGLWLTSMLVQKSLRISNPTADRVCGVLQAGGCDNILEMKASKFFGLFGWSEVGFAYFSVSLLALLLFPQAVPWLAGCCVCCLPFTVWSIWYQRFRAHAWCTLCVAVQCTLWLLFFCYLGGGWVSAAWPPAPGFFLLGLIYLTVLLALNRILPKFDNTDNG